jgi:polysaccharide biosynthesis transport protein
MAEPILNQNLKRFLHTLLLWMPLWVGTTFGIGMLGAVYAYFLKQDLWLASQGYMVRDEANVASMRPGRFDSDSQMKAAQETILEVARNEQVVSEALSTIGSESSWFSWFGGGQWPSTTVVRSTAGSLISIRAPKGAEFGATEVIYLDVKQSSAERALAFNRALSAALETRLQQVRKSKAESIRSELVQSRDLARQQLRESTELLQKIEASAGIELSDLRGMTDMIAGGGNSRQHLDQLKAEIRGAETSHQELLDSLHLLDEAIADPAAFIVAPSGVVSSQPGLKRLHEGYAEAQLSASQLSGKFTDQHPLLVAARRTQLSIQERLVNELESSKINLNQEVKSSQQRLDRLKRLQAEAERKLAILAENRAEYANLIAEVKTRTAILEGVERELAEAEAASTAASKTSLINRLDEPTVSEKPIGPGRTTITLASAITGLVLGFGLMLVITPTDVGRRFGRRVTDVGRRVSDRSNEPASDATIGSLDRSPHGSSPPVASQTDASTATQERVSRTLADRPRHANRRNRPAPILYDESTISSLRSSESQPDRTSNEVSALTEAERAAEAYSALSLLEERDLPEIASSDSPFQHEANPENVASESAPSEHPSDPLFRDFLLEEIAKSSERRQHPRPAKNQPKPVTLGQRDKP